MIIFDIILILIGCVIGVFIMAVLSLTWRKEALDKAYRLGFEMGRYDSCTIDVTELCKKDSTVQKTCNCTANDNEL